MSGPDVTPKTESRAREALRQVIKDWGLDDPRADPPHGWRCQHPELSNPATCGHVDALLDDLEEAASKAVAEAIRDAFAETLQGLRNNAHAPDVAALDPLADAWNRGLTRALEIVRECERRALIASERKP